MTFLAVKHLKVPVYVIPSRPQRVNRAIYGELLKLIVTHKHDFVANLWGVLPRNKVSRNG